MIPELAGTVKAIETIEVTISEVLKIASSLSEAESDVNHASTSFKNLTTSNTHPPAPAGPATPSSPSNKPPVAPGGEQLPSGQNQF